MTSGQSGNPKSRQIEFWVAKISDLPTLPSVVDKTIQVVNNPNSSIRQISETLSQDMSLSTRILRLANSGYYAMPGGANTVERAVTTLGIDNLSQMVFTAAVFSQFDLRSKTPFDIREFWKHSLGVAMASETIARELGLKDPTMIFLAGLVHDIGKIAHFHIAKENWLMICSYAQREGITIREAEVALGHVTHDDLGYELVRMWRLPPMIQEVVRLHHDPTALSSATQLSVYPMAVGTVYLANLLVQSLKFGSSGHFEVRNPSVDIVKRVLGSEKVLVHILKSVHKSLGKIEPLISTMFPEHHP